MPRALDVIVFPMEFDKTKWPCPWNSDQNCTQNSARGWWVKGVGGGEGQGVGGGRIRVVGVKG